MDDENHEGINYANFEYVKTLGKGTHGTVILAQSKINKRKYAIKSIKKHSFNDKKQLSLIKREVEIMANLCHPHIITVHDVCESNSRVTMTLEYASNGELFDYVNDSPGGLESSEVRRLFNQIASAVSYMHRNGVVHRDLKLENILLDGNKDAKIADFGLASIYTRDKLMFTYCGSPLYASPEIIKAQPYYGPEVDCWSLGVILYAMSFGSMPFDGGNVNRLRRSIIHGDYNVPRQAHPALNNLIHSLLQPDVDRRLIIKQILHHPWIINDGDNDGIGDGDGGVVNEYCSVDGSMLNNNEYRRQVNIYDGVSYGGGGGDMLGANHPSSCNGGSVNQVQHLKYNNLNQCGDIRSQHVGIDPQHVGIESQHFRKLLKEQLDKFSLKSVDNKSTFNNNNNGNNNNNNNNSNGNNNNNNNIIRNSNNNFKSVQSVKNNNVRHKLESYDSLEFSKDSSDHPFTDKKFANETSYNNWSCGTNHKSNYYQTNNIKEFNYSKNQNPDLNVANVCSETNFSLSKSPNSLCVYENLHSKKKILPERVYIKNNDNDNGKDDIVGYNLDFSLNNNDNSNHRHSSSPPSPATKPMICELTSPKKLSISSDVAIIYDLKTSSFGNLNSSTLKSEYDFYSGFGDDPSKHLIPRHKSEPHNFEVFEREISSDVLVVEEENLILRCNNLKINHKSYRLVDKNKDIAVAVAMAADVDVDDAGDDDENDDHDGCEDFDKNCYRKSNTSHLFCDETDNDDTIGDYIDDDHDHEIIVDDDSDEDDVDGDDDGDDGDFSYHYNDIDEVLNQLPVTIESMLELRTSAKDINNSIAVAKSSNHDVEDDRYSIDSLDT